MQNSGSQPGVRDAFPPAVDFYKFLSCAPGAAFYYYGMGSCILCGSASPYISQELQLCLACIRSSPGQAVAIAAKVHGRSRAAFGLPEKPPDAPGGVPCMLCVNECIIPEGATGYCGLRTNSGGVLVGDSSEEATLSWYHDPLPTNCVADWVCPGGARVGFPTYSHREGAELGYKNLAVFFRSCSFNCLFCQNWQFKRNNMHLKSCTVETLAENIDERTSCICFFGGDPSTQLSYSIAASRLAREQNPGKILRICWETNGSMNPGLLDEMIDLALVSGGCIKFDLKAFDENLHRVLCGVSNRRTLANFRSLLARSRERPSPPLAVASTLIVPGYIDEGEVRQIASFIARCNPATPYCLIAFYPNFYLSDLPFTPKELAYRCQEAAQEEGLVNVTIGNIHLLV